MASESSTLKRPSRTAENWTRGLVPLLLLAAVMGLLSVGLMLTNSPVVVEVDGQRFRMLTHADTVGGALHQAGFDLHPEDLISPALDTPLRGDAVVQVRRALPIILRADGQIRHYRTQAATVGEFLTRVGVATGPADEVWLDDRLVKQSTPLGDGVRSPGSPSQRGGGGSVMGRASGDPPMIVLRRAASLTLVDAGVTRTLHSTSETVAQVLQEHGVLLFLGDQVTPGLQDRITPDMTIGILRSVPVQIDVDGHLIHTRSRAETVAGVLGQEGIALVGKDRVEPILTEVVQPDMTIRVVRVREELVIESAPIPFETVWVPDPGVEIDNVRLAQEGQVGLTKRRFRVVYENGQETHRVLEDVWAAQAPITKTMAYGTKIVIRTLETSDGPIEYWRKMRVYTTSYKPSSSGKPKDHPRYGYTRLGWKLKKGIVAVDPEVIPLRTKMYVPGYGLARAGDTGGGVKGKFVDLGFEDSNYESWHWWTDVYLLTPVPPPEEIRWVLPNLPRFPDRKRD